MNDDNKILALLTLLTRLTSEKNLRWEAATPPSAITSGSDDVVSLYFETRYKTQTIAVYERRHQLYSGEIDQMYWTTEIVVAFLDAYRRNLWQYSEQSAALLNLFELIRRSAAKVDDLLDDLLRGSSSEA